jgi:dienelactone hydrolase
MMEMRKEEMISVEFVSSDNVIQGYFFPSSTDRSITTVIFLQGFPGAEGDELICERLAQEQVNVLTFNFRGTFRSEGYFSFTNAIADIGAALYYLKESQNLKAYMVDPENIVLGGWSFGGGIVPAGAVQYREFRKIFSISGRDFGREAREIERDPTYAKAVAGNLESIRAPNGPVKYKDDILSDLIENRVVFEIEGLIPYLIDCDVLLIGGWDDRVVAIEDHILPLYRLLAKNGAKVRIEAFQDDHEFYKNKDRLVQVIVNWLKSR